MPSNRSDPADLGGQIERDVKSLQHLSARLVKGGAEEDGSSSSNRLDIKCWEQIEQGLTRVLDHIPAENELLEAMNTYWTFDSPAGRVALECMQAVVEHAPAAMRAVISSSQQLEQRREGGGHLDVRVIPKAVCKVLEQLDYHMVTLPLAWPSGPRLSALALAKVGVLIPPAALNDPLLAAGIILGAFKAGYADLPLAYQVDLILIQVGA